MHLEVLKSVHIIIWATVTAKHSQFTFFSKSDGLFNFFYYSRDSFEQASVTEL